MRKFALLAIVGTVLAVTLVGALTLDSGKPGLAPAGTTSQSNQERGDPSAGSSSVR